MRKTGIMPPVLQQQRLNLTDGIRKMILVKMLHTGYMKAYTSSDFGFTNQLVSCYSRLGLVPHIGNCQNILKHHPIIQRTASQQRSKE